MAFCVVLLRYILGLILFIIFIIDIIDPLPKFWIISTYRWQKHFQAYSYSIWICTSTKWSWYDKTWLYWWLVSLKVSKCEVAGYSYHSLLANNYFSTHKGNQIELEAVNTMKDLGVIFYSCLKSDQHIHEKINKACCLLNLIKRNFQDSSAHASTHLYTAIVRLHLEYANLV